MNDDGLPDIAWVDVPAGEVTLAENAGHFTGAAFCIARHPVTWRQYRAFVEAPDGYRPKRWWHGLRHEAEPGETRWDAEREGLRDAHFVRRTFVVSP
ncbi:SUMF1/EgtB/PvdO family nonheme iron enzyme [Candidatus Accumulibacter cognatus]|uniref:SUMF1/EgtB/PvdO family nonheme iron enzyme n=1 Tax=Candidatus Accumulibacter cognatus TaxID=2954383 RepID=A0A7D5SG38_9PROT|nr:SUMF1/EgtB/PvdO family nonheme iron enzyme [Candidatus Accumulibacter cognatus]QLH51379.1 MAG: SUMF1/EgtB/PvdO family nonheme iron enzyme [Candidatus Accumulibacter cognatus]